MNHPNPFPHGSQDETPRRRGTWRLIAIAKIVIIALVLLVIVLLHVLGIVGVGLHAGG